jgi:hypothetical protein
MNKEIIHQAAQAHAEKSLYHDSTEESNVYTYWAYCSVRLQKALQIGWKILKPEYFGIQQQTSCKAFD